MTAAPSIDTGASHNDRVVPADLRAQSSWIQTRVRAEQQSTSMPGDEQDQAKQRLAQVSSHLSSTSPSPPARRSRRQPAEDALPADYSDLRGQLDKLKEIASTPPTHVRGYVRQKEAGKLWVRERVELLLDPGSFVEVGSVTGSVEWKPKQGEKRPDGSEPAWDGIQEEVAAYVPSNSVQGFGKLHGRKVVFTADDYTIRAGHADGAMWAKSLYLEKLSLSLRLPMIKLVDGSSGGGSVTTIKTQGFSYIPPVVGMDVAIKSINAGIPNLGAILGPAIGLGAARVTLCHFSVMTTTISSLFNAGPAVVAGATFEEGLTMKELGGPDMHARNGTIDNVARDEAAALQQIRTVLSYLPNCGSSALPPILEASDSTSRTADALRSIIPRRKNRAYSPRQLLAHVVDQDSFFEIGGLWGMTIILGLARLNGKTVGVVANNPEAGGGALDALGSQKLTKHLKFCDIFNIPVLQFVDVPGYAVGTVAERERVPAPLRSSVPLILPQARRLCAMAFPWPWPITPRRFPFLTWWFGERMGLLALSCSTAGIHERVWLGRPETGALCRWRAASKSAIETSSTRFARAEAMRQSSSDIRNWKETTEDS